MNKLLIFSFCLLFSTCLRINAQWTDNFNDGDFTSNPEWFGDSSLFQIDQGWLRLNAPNHSDTAMLSVKSDVGLNAIWQGTVKLLYNPSSSNYAKIYLMSNNSNLISSTEAYYIKIGGSEDEISLYLIKDNSEIKLIDGRNKVLNSPSVDIKFKVTRNKTHEWELFSDSNSSGVFVSEGSCIDSSILSSSYFGVQCRYTSTRSDKFYFDNFSVDGEVFLDTIPPSIIQHEITNVNIWDLYFSEPIDTSSISPNNIFIYPSSKQLKHFTFKEDENLLSLEFDHGLSHGIPLFLNLDSIRDTAGNIMPQIQLEGFFTNDDSLVFKDIIINEMMIDPSPPVSLPEIEYIELLNRSKYHLNLHLWSIADTKDTCVFPKYIMKPGEIICLVDEKEKSNWINKSNTLFVNNLPGLNNDADYLQLYTKHFQKMDSICYTQQWYGSETKKEGGWALERINPNFLCPHSSNWKASLDESGGSPGFINSVFEDSISDAEPIETKILALNNKRLEFMINKPIFYPIKTNQLNFSPELSIKSLLHNNRNIIIDFKDGHDSTSVFHLKVSEWKDCYNNELPDLKLEFSFPGEVISGDIVINEILFNPYTGGSDFVEIYNASNKTIDMFSWCWANFEGDSISNIEIASEVYLPIKPNHYMVFSKDPENICMHYSPCADTTFYTSKLPPYNDEYGSVILLNPRHQMFDRFDYNYNLHFPLINNAEGVSLERISPTRPSDQASNWHSASSLIGYASPGYKNSQSVPEGAQTEAFYLHPTIFSPDNDAYNDIVTINYNLGKPGFFGSIKIYNENAMIVRDLVVNQLFSTEGSYSWDGIDNDYQKSPVGYYIVLMEVFNDTGQLLKYKSTVVLAHHMQ